MTSREQFEAWCNSGPDRSITMEDSTRFFCAWESWQASREAVEIELPSSAFILSTNQDSLASMYVKGIDDASKAIRAAGIKVKGE